MPNIQTEEDFIRDLALHIRAGYQVIGVITDEDARFLAAVQQAAEQVTEKLPEAERPLAVHTWDTLNMFKPGLTTTPPKSALEAVDQLLDPDLEGSFLSVFRDMHAVFPNSPALRRQFLDAIQDQALNRTGRVRPIIVQLPTMAKLPDDLSPHIPLMTMPLPSDRTLQEMTGKIIQQYPQLSNTPAEETFKLAKGARGLPGHEAQNALFKAILAAKGINSQTFSELEDTKSQILEKNDVLTYIPRERIEPEENVGDYDELIDFVRRRKLLFTEAAEAEGLDKPKGLILLGVPGAGKSMVGQTVARVLDLPLCIFDVSRIFDSLVGSSERRMDFALRTVTSLQGAVLLIDEADKAFSGVSQSTNDSGVSRRVFGQLLSWLAAKRDRTFVVMTMNRIDGIPPELLRRGRFDELFFVDLPGPEARQQILEIHLKKRGIDPTLYAPAMKTLVTASNNFVGAELEEVVIASRLLAFEQTGKGVPSLDHLMMCINETTPMATLSPKPVEEIRKFCKEQQVRPVNRVKKRAVGSRQLAL